MAWQLSGRSMELCSCKMLCPCWLGPEGCLIKAGAAAHSVSTSNGAVPMASISAEPGSLSQLSGQAISSTARGRLVCTSATLQIPRSAANWEAIFSGKKGGLLEGLWGAVISNWLPTETAEVEIGWGDSPFLRVGSFGQATLTALKDQSGKPTRVEGAAAQAAFQFPSMDLASSKGSRWSDPKLRQWQGDSGTLHRFNWSA
jgi:hypothetical protein